MSETKKLFKKISVTLIVVLSLYLISSYVVSVNFITGNSMKPYVCDGGIVITKTGNYQLERYGVYIIKLPKSYTSINEHQYKLYGVKRLIGLPNDVLKFEDGIIYINGNPIDEKYDFNTDTFGNNNEVVLGENEYFFMGDNRNHSDDSRLFGSITDKDIVGEVIQIIYKGKEK